MFETGARPATAVGRGTSAEDQHTEGGPTMSTTGGIGHDSGGWRAPGRTPPAGTPPVRQTPQEHTSPRWIAAVALAIGLALLIAVVVVGLTDNHDPVVTLDLSGDAGFATVSTPPGAEGATDPAPPPR
jgi:hypothetical protein